MSHTQLPNLFCICDQIWKKLVLCAQELKSILSINIIATLTYALSIHFNRTVIDGQVFFSKQLAFPGLSQALKRLSQCLGEPKLGSMGV